MKYKETFGAQIRRLRKGSGFPIRKVAASLDLDPSTLSKIERNERPANRSQVSQLARLFKITERDLLVSYLSDKVVYALEEEDLARDILHAAEQKIVYATTQRKKS